VLLAAKRLDKHYIPARYPNGFDRGAPRDYYTEGEARQAINDAETVYHFCRDTIR
jgi:HEPN domain-containing protein